MMIWAMDLVTGVDEAWKACAREGSDYPFKKYGYAVFYSPVPQRADLLILGFNPGGKEPDFADYRGVPTIPESHEHVTSGEKLASATRQLFASIGREDVVVSSVKSNLIFFRTRRAADWQKVPIDLRGQLEDLCDRSIRDMIDRLKPKVILLEGIGTYERFAGRLFKGLRGGPDERPVPNEGRWVYVSNRMGDTRIAGILHLSGARPSGADMEKIASALRMDLNIALGGIDMVTHR